MLAQYWVTDTTVIERQDAIVRDGIIVGVKDITPASEAEIIPGMQAFIAVQHTDDGIGVIRYIRVGDPFPKP